MRLSYALSVYLYIQLLRDFLAPHTCFRIQSAAPPRRRPQKRDARSSTAPTEARFGTQPHVPTFDIRGARLFLGNGSRLESKSSSDPGFFSHFPTYRGLAGRPVPRGV